MSNRRKTDSQKENCPVCGKLSLLIQRVNGKKCASCWAAYPGLVSKLNLHTNRAIVAGLPATLSIEELEFQFHKYGKRCPLTGSPNTVMDHWIALETGHGGTYHGNIVFLDKRIHETKGTKNPFLWLQEKGDRFSYSKVMRLVSDLASQNRMTVFEFERFVTWCFQHPQSKVSTKTDRRSSIEKWHESLLLTN